MFPPIQPHSTKVSSVKRVLMIFKDQETGAIELRHYAIDAKPVEGSKSIKKLINAKTNIHKRLPNLNRTSDVSELLTDPYSIGAFTSDSEVEEENIVDVTETSATTVKKDVSTTTSGISSSAAETNVRKKAIKLTEIGPRLKLHLTKIEEGISTGKVLYHHNIKKSKKEQTELEQKHAERQRIKRERKEEQAANIAEKKSKKEAKKERRKQREEERKARLANGEEVSEDEDEEDADEEEQDADEEEIPEDLDSDLYSDVDEMDED
ncbi:SSF1 [Cyberlindnera jadinii]|uniref:SSF1 protein n=1 Tax=Cyberlindnera jadinii (strain ATCC 18201 / CBS 1600 / BCRC 20928 / JCM 3617 / NBRC 0987 / NRRL Y-1542) TaxID=983966 RepID=A0A0H5C0A4_CYBJN|nr:SSF1 [Cyberlindnera jadinii]